MSPNAINRLLISAMEIIFLCCMVSCNPPRVTRELHEVEKAKFINTKELYLKAHMNNGELYVLHTWKVDDAEKLISGYGNHLDVNRKIVEGKGSYANNVKQSNITGLPFSIPYSEIVLVETNDRGTNPAVAAMIVSGLATAAFGILCAVNPKACFGSCPTFYVDHGDSLRLVGEGFSSSISKSMEAVDVDIIDAPIRGAKQEFSLTVKNEALETHMIKRVKLLVVPKAEGNRVLRVTGGDYFEVADFQKATSVSYAGKPVGKRLDSVDNAEWYSLADSSNLLVKEEIDLEYANPGGEIGLALVNRQSLMTTFLFYHSLSLLGSAAGHFYARMENGIERLIKGSRRVYELLGGIEVGYQDTQGKWKWVAEINEQGPIAEDYNLIKLPKMSGTLVKIKLRMTKGLWRINAANLVSVVAQVRPISLDPFSVMKDGVEDASALSRLNSGSEYLVTYPGEDYRLKFAVPLEGALEYFIESEGYYIEWMRNEWLAGENLNQARSIFISPRKYLRAVAAPYKAQEPEMEYVFWNSRYTKR